MMLRSKNRQDALLAGCFLLLLLGHVSLSWLPDAETDDKTIDDETCLLPSDKGFCKGRFLRWYHDRFTKTCRKFSWGGCGGNDNNFLSEEECEEACHVIKDSTERCLLPRDVGLCKASFPRWYYDQYSKTCKKFHWGGCGGNDNNFESEEECEQICNMDNRGSKNRHNTGDNYWMPH